MVRTVPFWRGPRVSRVMGWGLWRVVLTVRVGSCNSRDEILRNIGVERERRILRVGEGPVAIA